MEKMSFVSVSLASFMLSLFFGCISAAYGQDPGVLYLPSDLVEVKLKKPLYKDKGFYLDNGYSFALVLGPDERKAMKDNLFIDARLGYLISEQLGLHLAGGYFSSSVKNSPTPADIDYFYIGPGVKGRYLFKDSSWSLFADAMIGYGQLDVSSSAINNPAKKKGLAVALDFGVTYKALHWLGFSPYLTYHIIGEEKNGQDELSQWLQFGLMLNLSF
jgi:hypothetical protein